TIPLVIPVIRCRRASLWNVRVPAILGRGPAIRLALLAGVLIRDLLVSGRYLRQSRRNRQLHFHGGAGFGVIDTEFSAQPAHAFPHSADAYSKLFEIRFCRAAAIAMIANFYV